MANAKGLGINSTAKRTTNKAKPDQTWQGMPQLDLETRIQLWQAGLLRLQLPDGMQPRSLTVDEKYWLDRAAAAAYIAPQQQGQTAIFYTAPPPDFRLDAAEWYLHPDDYWNAAPVRLSEIMATFPAALFQLSASGQPPAFYPDRTPNYTHAQEATMRSIFRETVRLGWSLPDYKWFVMRSLHKTTAQVTQTEADGLLQVLQANTSAQEL